MQKALSKLARARIFNTLNKQYFDDKNYTVAATLLSTAAPGAMAWVTFNDYSYKTHTLTNDNFSVAMSAECPICLQYFHPVCVDASRDTTTSIDEEP